ncbi:hypothetical protein SYNPS1DRAFT_20654 [Syncephalis pseudoplumigaleata]|uniref:BLOC-1-related complex subunit 6 C-terminal helix domain-containing protein n=1 Tax=Syncephalis pseudoplumigaleata TaxID=1712513 RepID=A0A4P9Z5Z3_9FUNG|nr:hypothetical protein SYNPS1DRAFT_20654 [Syncephalis pseudoplumigaleata]|eukprot:RKP27955.1 hypothetical protein SYNPS1DRAFT_20654 [Syncephalis pseudoplumigaleata]
MTTSYAVEDRLGKLEQDLELLRYPYALDRQAIKAFLPIFSYLLTEFSHPITTFLEHLPERSDVEPWTIVIDRISRSRGSTAYVVDAIYRLLREQLNEPHPRMSEAQLFDSATPVEEKLDIERPLQKPTKSTELDFLLLEPPVAASAAHDVSRKRHEMNGPREDNAANLRELLAVPDQEWHEDVPQLDSKEFDQLVQIQEEIQTEIRTLIGKLYRLETQLTTEEDGPKAPLPDDIVEYLERQAYVVAHQFQSLMAGLHDRLQDMTHLTLENVQTHAFAVERFDAQAKALVEAASALIVQCDHLDQEMESIHAIADQLKGFHQMLDLLEQRMRL